MDKKWKDGFSKKPILVDARGHKNLSIGSEWNESSFILTDNEKEIDYYHDDQYALVADGKVFGLIIFPNDMLKNIEKYDAATGSKVIGLDITEINNVRIGQLTDGEKIWQDS